MTNGKAPMYREAVPQNSGEPDHPPRSLGSGRFFPSTSDLESTGTAQAALHERAAACRREIFGNFVFVRAVVEISNFCRENCRYCGMRRDNRELARFRADPNLIAELVLQHRPQSVTDINIQAGEDPIAVREVVLPLVNILRKETSLGVSVCLGTLPLGTYQALKEAGASIYIMKFEMADARQYELHEAPGTLKERLENIRLLAREGWNVSSGFIAGLPGQTLDNLLENIALANSLPLSGCSVSPFIPGGDTPLKEGAAPNPNWTFNTMSALRLMRPDWIIPAVSALNLCQKEGYRWGLRAGANLATVNMTPANLREDYVIYKRDRFIMTEQRILEAISAEGLQPSKTSLAEHYRRAELQRPSTKA